EMVRVDREDARLRIEREQQVEEDRLLLLERARERHRAGELVDDELEDLLGGQRLDVSGETQAAPPGACRRAGRAAASRAGLPRRAGCSRGSRSGRTSSRTTPGSTSSAPRR